MCFCRQDFSRSPQYNSQRLNLTPLANNAVMVISYKPTVVVTKNDLYYHCRILYIRFEIIQSIVLRWVHLYQDCINLPKSSNPMLVTFSKISGIPCRVVKFLRNSRIVKCRPSVVGGLVDRRTDGHKTFFLIFLGEKCLLNLLRWT